ncbi:hypothetical protein GCM10025878_07560 [Leuconostoc gasicomitatum]|nr:hypothetical protein GCM10025878_07560 [Leuconostoc gasicomitatum]CBL91243.1 hypothetical protein LEGAS_0595 [Leuconostoc gasicomitatum LMG 18811]
MDTYEVKAIGEHFASKDGIVYRCGQIFQYRYDQNHQLINQTLIKTNHARVAYDTSQLAVIKN